MAAYWRSAEGAVADLMNRLPKAVCSRRPGSADWSNTTVLDGDAAATVAELKQQGDGIIYLFGSAVLSRTLMNVRLFDEYRLGIAPIVHGRGRRLFDDGVSPAVLQLLEARPMSSGCVILRYQETGRKE